MDALAELAREHAPRVLGVLTASFGDLDLADDAVQDALVQAVQDWPTDGVPPNPPAWLMTVAQRKAVDHLRRACECPAPGAGRRARADRAR